MGDVMSGDDGKCKGWKRGACPCNNLARIGHLTCGKHAHQEEIVERWAAIDKHRDELAVQP